MILACSARMVELACKIDGATIVNARTIKPLDYDFLDNILNRNVITLEDGVVLGGFGQTVTSYLVGKGFKHKIVNLGYNDEFISDFDIDDVMRKNGLTVENIEKIMKEFN